MKVASIYILACSAIEPFVNNCITSAAEDFVNLSVEKRCCL